MPTVARSFLSLFILCALGCHSIPVANSPETEDATLSARWIGEYRAARGAPADVACRAFSALAREPRFPVPRLAELRADEACDDVPFSFERAELPSYLRDLGVDVGLKVARRAGDRAEEAEVLSLLARRKLPQRERIAHLKLALRRAAALNDAALTERLSAQLRQVAPRLNPAPKPAEYLAVAADFRQARDFGAARRYFEKIIAGDFSTDEKIQALKGLRTSIKNQRRPEDHLKAAHRLSAFLIRRRALGAKAPRARAAAYDALTYEARALWTAGRPAEAARIFARLELELRGKYPLADLYVLRARLAEESNDFAEVTRYLTLALGDKPGDVLRDKILWYLGWNERARGRRPEAIAKLRELDETTKDDSTRVRALYWLGDLLRETDRARDADRAFERVIALDPVGYYGLLAHRQLGRLIRLRTAGTTARREPAPTLDTGLADWLVAFGEKDPLALLVDEAAALYLKRDDQTDAAWTDLLGYFGRAGYYLKTFEGLSALSPERRRGILDAHPDILFPRPWSEVAEAAAARAGIDVGLVYAIMRQESAFDPQARSGADAFGLMQLLPEVAARLARAGDVRFEKPEDLYDPAVAIPLGAAFLRELSDRYRGQLILLSAAYNASDAAIANWVRQRYRGDALAFIEEIPYEETRTYVRLVMRNLIFYQLPRAGGAGVRFPESVLRMDGPTDRAAVGSGPSTE